MNLKKWIFSSLRTKMLVMFVMLTVTPLIFVGIVSYVKSYNIVSEQSHTLAQFEAERLSRDIDVLFQDIKRFTEIGEQESTIQFLINQKNTQEEATSTLNMIKFYRESYPSSKHILDISIMNNSKVLSESRGVYQFDPTPSQIQIFSSLNKDPTTPVINTTVKNGFPAISMTTAIVRSLTGETIGFINIIIDASAINNILNEGLIGDSGSFHIESEYGENLYHSSKIEGSSPSTDWSVIGKNSSGYYTDSTSTFFVFTTSEMTSWKIVGHAPISEIMKEANDIRSLIFLSVTSSIIFTIGLYFFISSKLIRPLQILKQKMKQASYGDFNVKVINNSDDMDEISELGSSFNSMIKKIKSLLKKSIDEQKQLKIAEFRALQAQVNPHFLYNTLDTIIWMAEAKNTSQVIDVTKALSQFFRISLSKGKDWITLYDEIEHVRNYLIIQKIRYEDILEVTYHLNEDILDYKILKLALQPLVENAIYHGIKNKRGKGFIRIKGDINAQGHIVIDIIDNGIGIKEKRLDEIRTQLARGLPLDNGKGGFGMVNVHQRIRLYYGEPFGLTINSWYRSGTRICLTIPTER
ncbi:sensor histidine kinase [Aquibacillus rhizosphaerae]|uniref:Sensor histidine kinase n=1 Tax=Aquibacillus rhizosphaerae TaxID=3051431 RepID=A0ABT7L488_9BACI|nr:sensor histidine kinase [Aquibacillus sp. LR5S19]MDL4840683.1 sensor histidine kinase [Aquibacillus sp. LR5S19]